jgi:structural maintenance of chromosome 1
MPVTYLELENFKSYAGLQRIGPFRDFTSVIGPNGSGKSNLMDAVSFVLGVQSRELRSQQLKDLIHRPPPPPDGRPLPPPLSCRATLHYQPDDHDDEDSTESDDPILFTRTISATGVGAYHIDGIPCSYAAYAARLAAMGVRVAARNFLVFQGDVEALARKSPVELVQWVEQISQSADWADAYDKAAAERAEKEQAVVYKFQQSRAFRSERKLLQEQTKEAELFRKLQKQKADLQTDLYLWQLYHLERDRESREQVAATARTEREAHVELETSAVALLSQLKKKASVARRTTGQLDKKRVHLAASLDQLEPSLLAAVEDIKTLKQRLVQDEKQLIKRRQEADSHQEKMAGIGKEIAEYSETYNALENDYSEIKRNASPEEHQLTEEQEQEYERVREAAAAASADSRRVLTGLAAKLDSVRSKTDGKTQELQEAQANFSDIQRDVAEFTDRRDKLQKVGGVNV